MKYGVYFVEDEIAIRDMIKSSVAWEDTDFVVVGTAPDGEIAFPQILKLKPDILVTDIRMPFVDGLELSKMVKKAHPEMRIVLLSGYNDFEYACEAIRIGVSEYLLKPVTPAKMLQVLKKVALDIEQERTKAHCFSALKKELESIRPEIEERYLLRLVVGDKGVSLDDGVAEQLGIEICAPFYLVLVVDCGARMDIAEFRERLGEDGRSLLMFRRSCEEIGILLRAETENELAGAAYSLAKSISADRKGNGRHFRLGTGSVVSRLNALPESYESACSILGPGEDVGVPCDAALGQPSLPSRKGMPSKEALTDYLKTGLPSGLDAFCDRYFDIECLSKMAPVYLYYLLIEVFFTAEDFVVGLGFESRLIPQISVRIDEVCEASEIKGKIREILVASLDCREKSKRDKYRELIARVKGYIAESYGRGEIHLKDLSQFVGLSPSHLSSVFSKQMGTTITEYITEVRIAKAKELLRSSGLRAAEVAERVGYFDPNYFSTTFKKQTGMTPKEYRSQ
jgi:two-component system response regulator YesN